MAYSPLCLIIDAQSITKGEKEESIIIIVVVVVVVSVVIQCKIHSPPFTEQIQQHI